jgi:hypothetical protein
MKKILTKGLLDRSIATIWETGQRNSKTYVVRYNAVDTPCDTLYKANNLVSKYYKESAFDMDDSTVSKVTQVVDCGQVTLFPKKD